MIKLAPGEIVLMTMRRHWIVFVGPFSLFAFMFSMPPVLLLVGRQSIASLATPYAVAVSNFFLAIYVAGLAAALMVRWLKYYLDAWIITNERVMDIEQITLFHREISEIYLDRVQNITVEIPGFMATVLAFGNIRIQTAGAGEFAILQVADFAHAKDLILKHSKLAKPSPASRSADANAAPAL